MASPNPPEAAVISTPNPFHRENAEEALALGLHVSVTKPLCNTAADAAQVIARAREAGRVLQCAHEYRFRPPVAAARELHRRGELGNLTLATAHMGSRAGLGKLTAAGAWRSRAENVPGGCLNMLGTHMFDLANVFLGKPVAVTAQLRRLRTASELDDTAAVLIEYESGALANVTSSYASPTSDLIHIFGTDGNALIHGGNLTLETEPEAFQARSTPVTPLPAKSSGIEVVEHFCRAIREGGPAEPSGEDGLLSVRMLEAAVESQNNHGKRVKL